MSDIEYVHYDRGVRATRHPDTRGYYRIRYTDPSTGRPADARRRTWHEAEALALDLAGGLARVTAGQAEHGHQPLIHLIDDHLEDRRGRYAPQSLRTHRSYLNRYVVEPWGHLPCRDWNREITAAILDRAQDDGLAGNTRANLLRTLGGLAETGRLLQYLPAEAKPTARFKISNRREIDLTNLPSARHVQALADAFADHGAAGWWALGCHLLSHCGLRVGEALGLRAGDVDLDSGDIRVERQVTQANKELAPPKYGSVRTAMAPAWMDDILAARLEQCDDDTPLLPAHHGGHASYQTYKTRFDRAAVAAGWPRPAGRRAPWTPHTLRHYFCTWALSAQPDGLGLDVADVSRFVGHRNPNVTWSIYVQSRPDRVSRAREASRTASR